jgi:hypothetical protein
MINPKPILLPVHGPLLPNRNISVRAPVTPVLSPVRKEKAPGKYIQPHRKEKLMWRPAPQQGKAETAATINPPLLHRNTPLLTDRVQETPILLLPAPEAAVLLLLQNHTVRLPAAPPGQVAAEAAAAAEAVAAEAAVEEAAVAEAVAVHMVVVVHAEEGNNPKIS